LLADVAADSTGSGLLHPLVLDHLGTLADGRNRLATCHVAGVERTSTTRIGNDPAASVVNATVTRRHASEGKVAKPVARTSIANHDAPELADQVLAGTLGLRAIDEEGQTDTRDR
jgi:hypothetical protein